MSYVITFVSQTPVKLLYAVMQQSNTPYDKSTYSLISLYFYCKSLLLKIFQGQLHYEAGIIPRVHGGEGFKILKSISQFFKTYH